MIGNPPWDQIEQPEVEWFATRDPEIALAPAAGANRKAAIKRQVAKRDRPLVLLSIETVQAIAADSAAGVFEGFR